MRRGILLSIGLFFFFPATALVWVILRRPLSLPRGGAFRFVPLALALLAPIVVGILTFHVAMAPATIGPGIVVLVMELYLAWAYRGAFRPMLRARTSPGA